jgi:hypothetical protein
MRKNYPLRKELHQIMFWNIWNFPELLDFIEARWQYRIFERQICFDFQGKPILEWALHTAGWSGNEEIVKYLLSNNLFKNGFYYQWTVGGHYTFRIDPRRVGFTMVKDYCRLNQVTNKWIYKAKHKYEYFRLSPNKVFVRPFLLSPDNFIPGNAVIEKLL